MKKKQSIFFYELSETICNHEMFRLKVGQGQGVLNS